MLVNKLLLLSILSLLCAVIVGSNGLAYAHIADTHIGGPDDDISNQIEELESKIQEYEAKIAKLQQQEQSLQKEIDYANAQISLTETKIAQSEAQIIKKEEEILDLAQDIDALGLRIDKLVVSIDYQEEVLGERLRARYKSRESSPVMVIFGSATFNKIIQKTEYLKVMEKQDQKLLDEMAKTKDSFTIQKALFEDKKAKEELLKAQLEQEKVNLEYFRADLNKQKQDKAAILASTQNDEAKYQGLLRSARAELDAIAGIVNTINFANGEEVKKGDIIALMGNSGYPDCSTGAHLHFEVRKNGGVVNAEKYLETENLFVYDYDSGYKNIGSGDWDWPMNNPVINQRYGKTPWSWRYPSGQHDGIDMEASDIKIRAPEDGIYVTGTMGCYSSVIKYAAINHGDGVVSYYLHVQWYST